MKCLSLFTGLGGFELAMEKVFPNAELAGYSEIDKNAEFIFLKNFPEHIGKNLGDIKKIIPEELPDVDFIYGGFPCTDLTIQNKNRIGLAGSRSGLFFEFLRILEVKRPRFFLMENVATMSMENRNIIRKFLGELYWSSLFEIQIDSKLVTAQHRKRVYWSNWPMTMPQDKGILFFRHGIPVHKWSKTTIKSPILFRERITVDGKAHCVTCSGSRKVDSASFFPPDFMALKQRITTARKDLFYYQIKKEWLLTTAEMETLQGMPIGYTEGLINTARVKAIGNAVTVPVIEHLLNDLKGVLT